MEDNFQRYLLALAYVASLDPHPGCDLDDPETIKQLLQDQPSTKKNLAELLLQKEAETTYEIEDSKRNLSENKPIDTLLFRESNILEKTTAFQEIPTSTKGLKALSTTPKIQSPMEEILTKINVNNLKIKYVTAQNELLELYIRKLVQVVRALPRTETEPSLYAKLLQAYPNLNDTTENLGGIFQFLSEAPCSLHEIQFLASILREHQNELRNKKL